MRIIRLFSLFFSVVICITLAQAARKKPEHKIVLQLPKEPATLDWNQSNRRIDLLVINNIHEGLLEMGPDHLPRAVLAKSWSVSDDGKTYTFLLRDDAKWSDGKPVVAQQYVDSWKRLIAPLTASGNGYFLLDVVGAEDFFKGRETDFFKVGMKALDEQTIQIKLRKPMWNFIWSFALPATFPIRQDLIDKHGAKFWTAPGNLVTAGPFVLASHDLDSSFVLRKNTFYARHVGNLDEVEYQIVPDQEAISDFDEGSIDLVCYLSGEEAFPKKSKPYVQWTPAKTTKRLDFNVKRFPLTQVGIRKAISLAIDRKKLATDFGAGMTPATSAAPPAMVTYSKKTGLIYDPSAGRALVRSAEGEALTLELLVPLFDEHADENLKIAQMIKVMLEKNLHAAVNIQKAETEQLYSLLRDTQQYSILLRDWTATNDPDEFYAFYDTQTKKSTTWSNDDYDKLVEESRSEKDIRKRIGIYEKMERLLVENQYAVLPLLYEADATLVSPKIQNFDPKSSQPCKVRDLNFSK